MNGKQLKNSILQWAIQGKLVPQDPNDEPASVLLERIRAEKARLIKEGKIKKDKNESIIYRGEDNSHYEKFADGTVKCIDDEIPFEIPQGWEWARIRDVATVKGGKRIPLGCSFSPVETSHIYIRVTEMKNNTLVSNNLKYISDSVFEQIKNYTISKDDLYLTIAGTIGAVGIVPPEFDGMNLTENAVKLTNLLMNKDFLMFSIGTSYVQSQFSDKTKQMAQPKLAIERILTTLIAIPPQDEQCRILKSIKAIYPYLERYSITQTALDKLNDGLKDRLHKSILQEAIQGHLVPQDPNDEPVSVLLERIREEKQKLLKEGKIKKKDIMDSVIFKGDDNKYYEKVGGKVLDISDEIPFEVPKSWQWCRLGYVIHLQSGQDLTPDRYSDTPSGIPYITGASNFVDNTILVSRWTTTPTAIAHHGDLLITCKGTVGAMAYNNSGGDFHIARQIMAISSFEISLKYIELCIVFLLPQIEKEAHSIIPGISRDTILHSLIPIPPSNEQAAIVTRVKELYTRL